MDQLGETPAAGSTRRTPKKATTTSTEPRSAEPKAPERVDGKTLKGDARLIRMLRNVIDSAAEEDGFARISTIGQQIRNQSSADPRNYGYTTWTKLLKEIDLFELRDEGTTTVSVRDLRS